MIFRAYQRHNANGKRISVRFPTEVKNTSSFTITAKS